MEIKCEYCGRSFNNKKSYTNHRRWHDLPEYKDYQRKVKKELKRVLNGKITGNKNPNYKRFGTDNTFGGMKHSKETRELMKEKQKEFWESPRGEKAKKILSEVALGRTHTQETIEKMKEARSKQVCPKKDTKIEVKIQNFLKKMNVNFETHKYIDEINNPYQCDIFIPDYNLIIECDGDYWHDYPNGTELDLLRTNELKTKGFKILRLWEREIISMDIEKFKTIFRGEVC